MYKKGDNVQYKPIGGPNSQVSDTTGKVMGAVNDESGIKYEIRNDNTGKTSRVQEGNIEGSLGGTSSSTSHTGTRSSAHGNKRGANLGATEGMEGAANVEPSYHYEKVKVYDK
ncbi:hypothetical protein JX265_008066 [Neoarthrinium moseri]|uniref:Hypervirulence associated protein TUDOR domain-containing protein n=1 Tax=Neoarthrinium moseri TaxID=1658444 RepID=A0A9P9WJ38_9PEZI|nr:hypothetical protein JX265_008066 [Neoarthrinium moseri]